LFLFYFTCNHCLRAAPHGPSMSANTVGCHFDVILFADNDWLCGSGADTRPTMPTLLFGRHFDIIFVPYVMGADIVGRQATSYVWLMSGVAPPCRSPKWRPTLSGDNDGSCGTALTFYKFPEGNQDWRLSECQLMVIIVPFLPGELLLPPKYSYNCKVSPQQKHIG